MSWARRFWKNQAGASAAEFALILPGLLFLVFGSLNLCLVTYATVNLHSAVESAARYASIQTTLGNSPACGTGGSVQTYIASHYKGPGIGEGCTYSAAGACGSTGSNGKLVIATGSYKVFYGFGALPITINAKACFP